MYDFSLGTPEEIRKDELRYLVSVKRMLPRWVNSLPDSEFIALCLLLDEQGNLRQSRGEEFVVVETGTGCSSLALAFYAAKYGGTALSWDMNGAKGSEIRRVLTESISAYFGLHPSKHWKLVASDSLCPYLGLPILLEIAGQPSLSFHDSEHTWATLGQGLRIIAPMMMSESMIALDDANLKWDSVNEGYVNTFRQKLGLPEISLPASNQQEAFHIRCDAYLNEQFADVARVADYYKENYTNDAYFAYYDAEFDIKVALGTEQSEALDHRFDAWTVSGYKQ